MSAYEFQSVLHGNCRTMLDDMAREWLSGNGVWDRHQMREFLAHASDAEFAADCISGWGMDVVPDENNAQLHMQLNGYNADDLAAAFGRLRAQMAE